jgi:hypothetical protein
LCHPFGIGAIGFNWHGQLWSLPDLPAAGGDIFVASQFLQRHRAAGVEFVGADANLGAEFPVRNPSPSTAGMAINVGNYYLTGSRPLTVTLRMGHSSFVTDKSQSASLCYVCRHPSTTH